MSWESFGTASPERPGSGSLGASWLLRCWSATVVVRERLKTATSSLVMKGLSGVCSSALAHLVCIRADSGIACKVTSHSIFLVLVRLPQIDGWHPRSIDGGHLAEPHEMESAPIDASWICNSAFGWRQGNDDCGSLTFPRNGAQNVRQEWCERVEHRPCVLPVVAQHTSCFIEPLHVWVNNSREGISFRSLPSAAKSRSIR